MKIVIMAGGEGERLWPLSNEHYPKQFLEVGSHTSSLAQTIERFLSITAIENIWIVTSEALKNKIELLCEKQFQKKLPLIIEPIKKNTGFAITYAVKFLKEMGHIHEGEPLLFTPCDHKIEETDDLIQAIGEISRLPVLEQMVLFGIKPSEPHVGFGYIEVGSPHLMKRQPVLKFHEKPSIDLATMYFHSGRHFWNSGMVALSASLLEKELAKHSPPYLAYYKGGGSLEALPSISFDHLILEKSGQVEASLLDVKWLDIGSFEALFSLVGSDEAGNAAVGQEIYHHDATENWVVSSHKSVALLGVHQIAVIDTPYGLMISDRKNVSSLKIFKEKLKAKAPSPLLVRRLNRCSLYELYLDKGKESHIDLKHPFELELIQGACEIEIEGQKQIVRLGDQKMCIKKHGAKIRNFLDEPAYLLLIEAND